MEHYGQAAPLAVQVATIACDIIKSPAFYMEIVAWAAGKEPWQFRSLAPFVQFPVNMGNFASAVGEDGCFSFMDVKETCSVSDKLDL